MKDSPFHRLCKGLFLRSDAFSMDHTAILTSQQQQQPNSDSNSSFSSISQTLMHHQAPPPPSSTFASHFSRQPHTTLPNPFLSFPQPVLPSALTSSSDLHPPGTDPFANPGSYPSTNVEHGAHFQYYVDPNASSQNWVSEPIGYEAVSLSLSRLDLLFMGFGQFYSCV